MGSPAQPILDWRRLPKKILDTVTGEPYLHPLWQMLGVGGNTPAPTKPDTSQMMNWTPQPNEEQKAQIRREQDVKKK